MPKTAQRLKKALGMIGKLLETSLSDEQRADLDALHSLIGELLGTTGRDSRGHAFPSPQGEAPSKPVEFLHQALIAEDNLVNQRVACRLLQELGCRVDVARDGVEALELFDRKPYDLIFLDCRMPRLDGYETIAEIRRRESSSGNPRTPVIAMTAFALKSDRDRCLKAGMDDYLPKPVILAELRRVIGKWHPTADLQTPSVSLESGDPSEVAEPTPGLTDQPSTLNADRVASLKRRPRNLLRELIDLFRTETLARMSDLKQAVHERNLESIASLAHQLKGSAANLGAEKMSRICEKFEHCLEMSQFPKLILLFADLETEAGHVEVALAEQRKTLEKSDADLR